MYNNNNASNRRRYTSPPFLIISTKRIYVFLYIAAGKVECSFYFISAKVTSKNKMLHYSVYSLADIHEYY